MHLGLTWVDDESNLSAHHARNAIRLTVMPALASVSGNPVRTLARAAGLQAESARLADDLAAIDAREAFDGSTLSQRRSTKWPIIARETSCAGSCTRAGSPRPRQRGSKRCSSRFAHRAATR
jgi:tRNA(Ile)-lysidine synthase TilS/MesJ